MAIKLHRAGFDNAVKLIKAGEYECFDADWSEEKPTPTEENHFINTHFMKEYGLFFLGTDDKFSSEVKEHYVYPHGDLKEVQHSALADTLKKAEKNGDREIVKAVQELMDMLDECDSE